MGWKQLSYRNYLKPLTYSLLALSSVLVASVLIAEQDPTPEEGIGEPESVFEDGFESGSFDQWSNSEGGPSVVWDPDHIDVTVAVADQVPVRLTLLIRTDLPATNLELTPSLQGIVTVNPTSLPAVGAGTEVTVDLTLTATALEEFGGTLKVRQAEGPPRTFARPLPITIVGSEGSSLPPDPDPDINSATLEGIDSNGDGVRDDVEIFIATNWESRNDQEALMQYARALAQTYSPESYASAHTSISRARSCFLGLRNLLDLDDADIFIATSMNAWGDIKTIRQEMLSTLERTEAYLAYNSSLSGKRIASRADSVEDCEFVVEGDGQ